MWWERYREWSAGLVVKHTGTVLTVVYSDGHVQEHESSEKWRLIDPTTQATAAVNSPCRAARPISQQVSPESKALEDTNLEAVADTGSDSEEQDECSQDDGVESNNATDMPAVQDEGNTVDGDELLDQCIQVWDVAQQTWVDAVVSDWDGPAQRIQVTYDDGSTEEFGASSSRWRHSQLCLSELAFLSDTTQLSAGTVVEVFWEHERRWFRGTIDSFDVHRGEHFIHYIDGDQQWENLTTDTWRLVADIFSQIVQDDPPSPRRRAKKNASPKITSPKKSSSKRVSPKRVSPTSTRKRKSADSAEGTKSASKRSKSQVAEIEEWPGYPHVEAFDGQTWYRAKVRGTQKVVPLNAVCRCSTTAVESHGFTI